jgi:hypothetical protein
VLEQQLRPGLPPCTLAVDATHGQPRRWGADACNHRDGRVQKSDGNAGDVPQALVPTATARWRGVHPFRSLIVAAWPLVIVRSSIPTLEVWTARTASSTTFVLPAPPLPLHVRLCRRSDDPPVALGIWTTRYTMQSEYVRALRDTAWRRSRGKKMRKQCQLVCNNVSASLLASEEARRGVLRVPAEKSRRH